MIKDTVHKPQIKRSWLESTVHVNHFGFQLQSIQMAKNQV